MIPVMTFTVGTKDFRRALQAVLPHIGRDERIPMLCRARCYVDVDNMAVIGTDRYTAALGLVSVWEINTTDPVAGAIDLSLTDIQKILAVFKAGKDNDDDDAPAFQVRIDVRSGSNDQVFLRITDVSGLIDGEHLEVPALAVDDNFPDLPKLFATYLDAPVGLLDTFRVTGDLIGRLKTAASVYSSPLVMSIAGSSEKSPILVRCGESFLSIVMPYRVPEDQAERQQDWLRDWRRRLPPPKGVVDLATASGVILGGDDEPSDDE